MKCFLRFISSKWRRSRWDGRAIDTLDGGGEVLGSEGDEHYISHGHDEPYEWGVDTSMEFAFVTQP